MVVLIQYLLCLEPVFLLKAPHQRLLVNFLRLPAISRRSLLLDIPITLSQRLNIFDIPGNEILVLPGSVLLPGLLLLLQLLHSFLILSISEPELLLKIRDNLIMRPQPRKIPLVRRNRLHLRWLLLDHLLVSLPLEIPGSLLRGAVHSLTGGGGELTG